MDEDRPDAVGAEHRTKHRREENLKPPWQPGESGNPTGRPRGSVGLRGFMARVNEQLYQTEFAGQKIAGGRQVIDLAVEMYVGNMIKGSLPHVTAALPYTDGTPKATDQTDEAEAETVSPEVAERMLKAANEQS